MNVLLFVIDALRPDHLGMNGYSRDTSPHIDSLSNEGTTFLNAYCALPRTDPSLASIMTGLYPHHHGVRLVHGNPTDASLSTLAEILRSHGYRTALMSGDADHHPLVRKGFSEVNRLSWKLRNKIERSFSKAPLQYDNVVGKMFRTNAA